jgi:hypothetical protein
VNKEFLLFIISIYIQYDSGKHYYLYSNGRYKMPENYLVNESMKQKLRLEMNK